MTKISNTSKSLIKNRLAECIPCSPMLYIAHWVSLGNLYTEFSLCEKELGPEFIYSRVVPLKSQNEIKVTRAVPI